MWQRSSVSLSRLSQTRANMHLPEVFFSYAFVGPRHHRSFSFRPDFQYPAEAHQGYCAKKDPCVIVGRCADYILSDRDDVLNVFIEGNKPEKAARIKNALPKKVMTRSKSC